MSSRRFAGFWFWLNLAAATFGPLLASVYANLSHDLSDPDDLAYFPPFRAGANANQFDHLGGEYYEIARAV